MKNLVALELSLPNIPPAAASGVGARKAVPVAEPPAMLLRVVEQRVSRRGRALDIGCGTGAHSVFLARQGYEVTAVDQSAAALRAAEEHAREQGVSVRFIESDILKWKVEGTFELVLDSGCLQSLPARDRAKYREKLVSWLGAAADYVLIHLGKRHPLDWWPRGPRRRTRAQIVSELEPDLFLRVYSEESPDVSYWFRHA